MMYDVPRKGIIIIIKRLFIRIAKKRLMIFPAPALILIRMSAKIYGPFHLPTSTR